MLDDVIREAPRGRLYESRIAGMPWLPSANRNASGAKVDRLRFEGIAGRAFIQANTTHSAEAQHVAGVACLLIERPTDSIFRLEAAARSSPRNARIWSDLAAARMAQATRDVALLPAALASADHALSLDPRLSAAWFNRALALRNMGMRWEEKSSWLEAQRTERDLRWRQEIAKHINAVTADLSRRSDAQFDDVIRTGDATSIREEVRRNIEVARMRGETIAVSDWADAYVHGARKEARKRLRALRILADSIAAAHGDQFLVDVVRGIEHSSESHRAELARAHITYREARIRYSRALPQSESDLEAVATRFAQLSSPMQYVARFYAANAAFDRARVGESKHMLENVLRDVPLSYRSLVAGSQRLLGLCNGLRGAWSAALLDLTRSYQTFSELGEIVNAAFAEATLAEAYDRIGQADSGWRHRVNALKVLGKLPPDQRSLAVLIGAMHSEIAVGDLEAALSMNALAKNQAAQVGDPLLGAGLMLREARVNLVLRGDAFAQQSLSRARRLADTIQDRAIRGRVDADMCVVEGEVIRRTNPQQSVAIITRAIDFYAGNQFGILLPFAYLQRGRSYLVLGESDNALTDFQRGLKELERERAGVSMDARSTVFDSDLDLYSEAISLLLRKGNARAAYAVSERARARSLTEALGTSTKTTGRDTLHRDNLALLAETLPEKAIVVEYAHVQDKLIAFCVRHSDGLSVVELPVSPEMASLHCRTLVAAIVERKPIAEVRQFAMASFDDLIAPLKSRLEDIDTLYIVPDGFLSDAPFAALFDKSRRCYLFERCRISVSPSAQLLLRGHRRRWRRPSVLVVSKPSAHAERWLPAVPRETAEVVALYSGAKVLHGREATVQRFIAAVRECNLMHYAGHAGTDDVTGGFLPLSPTERDDGRLDASAISRLTLPKTQLVVLSACATLRSDVGRAKRIPSVARAFLTAGVPEVLGMLWDVDDNDAARLLLSFHKSLAVYRSPSAALQEAQRSLLHSQDDALSHPASWAFAELLGAD